MNWTSLQPWEVVCVSSTCDGYLYRPCSTSMIITGQLFYQRQPQPLASFTFALAVEKTANCHLAMWCHEWIFCWEGISHTFGDDDSNMTSQKGAFYLENGEASWVGWRVELIFSRSIFELAVKNLPGFVNVGLVEWVAARQVQHWMGILLRLSYQHGFLPPYYAIRLLYELYDSMSRNHKTIHAHRFGRSLVLHKYLSWALNCSASKMHEKSWSAKNVSGQRIHVCFSITKTILWEYPNSSHMKISSFVLVQDPTHSFSCIIAIGKGIHHNYTIIAAIGTIHAWLSPPYTHLW